MTCDPAPERSALLGQRGLQRSRVESPPKARARGGTADRVRRRNQIARMYDEQLANLPGLRFQKVDHRDVNTFKDYSILVNPAQFGMTRARWAVLARPAAWVKVGMPS